MSAKYLACTPLEASRHQRREDHLRGQVGRLRAHVRALRDDLKLALREHPDLAPCLHHDLQRTGQLLAE